VNLVHLAWRESRAGRGRLILSVAGIAVGVAALVAVQAFASALRTEARDQARSLLGADLAVQTRQPLGQETERLIASLEDDGVPVARVVEVVSMTRHTRGDGARLVRLRAADPGYPFYGRPDTEPAGGWAALEAGRTVLVEPGLLVALGAAVGDTLVLGDAGFEIVGTVERGSAELDVASAFAPRVHIALDHLDATGLVQFGSLVERAAYAAMTPARAAAVADDWRDRVRGEGASITTAEEQGETLGRTLARLASYLALVSVLALLLGGIGATSALRAHLAEREETVAVLRCLGATRRQVFALYLGQAVAVGAVGATIGAAAGLALQRVLPAALAGLIPIDVPPRLDLVAALLGVGTGLWVALAFALPALLEARGVPPLRALRRRLETHRRRDRAWVLAVVILGATAVAVVTLQSGDARLGVGFAAGALVALAVLHTGTRLALRALRAIPARGLPFAWRHGLANLHRPGNPARPAALALGAGTLLLVLLLAVEATLLRPLAVDTAGDRGNLLLWDVQDDQATGVVDLLAGLGHPPLQQAPIVPMRIAAINGRPVGPGAGEDGGDWATRREYRSTVRDTLVASERLTAGAWWGEDAAGDEVSLEEGLAEQLGVGPGDRIDWDVQGVRVPTRVTSLREVDWTRFEPNFFAVFHPAALEGAPRTWILLARVDDEAARQAVQGSVVRRFPNVSVLDLSHMQGVVDRVFGRVTFAIRFLAAFTLVAGLAVLAAAAVASRRERVRESVLLRTLGATRRQLRGVLVAESMALGVIGAGLGALAGGVAAWALAHWLFQLPLVVPITATALTTAAVALIATVAGRAAAWAAGRGTAMEALRDE
jgi:putative ABC transport system permease protein